MLDNTAKLRQEEEEKLKRKKEAARNQQEDWEMKKRSIAENVSRRTLLMEQSGVKRSSEALRLEQLRRIHGIVKEATEEAHNEKQMESDYRVVVEPERPVDIEPERPADVEAEIQPMESENPPEAERDMDYNPPADIYGSPEVDQQLPDAEQQFPEAEQEQQQEPEAEADQPPPEMDIPN